MAEALGREMARRGVRLVFGGGRVGLMGTVADAVIAGGGTTAGIIPGHLFDREVGHKGLTELHVVDSMHQRKQMMFDLSDAFAILPGGTGTLDEAFEILTWRQLGLHDKPIVLFDMDNYWAPLRDLVKHFIAHGFADQSTYDLFTVVSSVDGVFAAIEAAPEPALAPRRELL